MLILTSKTPPAIIAVFMLLWSFSAHGSTWTAPDFQETGLWMTGLFSALDSPINVSPAHQGYWDSMLKKEAIIPHLALPHIDGEMGTRNDNLMTISPVISFPISIESLPRIPTVRQIPSLSTDAIGSIAAVPEPSSLILLFIGVSLITRRVTWRLGAHNP